jgi:hypothetical protein
MPRTSIQAAIGAVIVNVTTSTDSSGSSLNGRGVAEAPRRPEVDEIADGEADAHRRAHLEVVAAEASDLRGPADRPGGVVCGSVGASSARSVAATRGR